MKQWWKYIVAISFFGVLVASYTIKSYAQDKKQIMTTFYPVYYLTQRIAGDAAEVTMLLDGNQDAHDYEASARDAVNVQSSDLFIYQSDEMEHFVEQLVKMLDQDQTTVVNSTQGIELLSEEEHEEESAEEETDDHDHDHSHEYDPHTWMDPMTYAKQAETIRDALIALDAENEAVYVENTEKLLEELSELDTLYRETLANRTDRTLVVQHAAFGYLAHAYDLEQIAITGISSTQEPSAAQIAQMQNFVQEHNVTIIYVEPSLDDSIAATVAQVSGAQLRPLRTLESVTAEEREQGVDYFTIMKENLAQLTE